MPNQNIKKKYFNSAVLALITLLFISTVALVYSKQWNVAAQVRFGKNSESQAEVAPLAPSPYSVAKPARISPQTVNAKSLNQTKLSFLDQNKIFSEIDKIRVTDSNEVVVDSQTRRHLDVVVNHLGFNLTEAELDVVAAMIPTALPEPAAEQAVKLLKDYYEYSKAQMAFSDMSFADSIESTELSYSQLKEIRIAILGSSTAMQLFSEEDTYMQKTIRAHKTAEIERNR